MKLNYVSKKFISFVLLLILVCSFVTLSYAWDNQKPCPDCGSTEDYCKTCNLCGNQYNCGSSHFPCDTLCMNCGNLVEECTCDDHYGFCDICNQYIYQPTHDCPEKEGTCDICCRVYSDCICEECTVCYEKGSKCKCERCEKCTSPIIKTTVPATCKAEGKIVHKCSNENCSYYFEEAISKKTCEMIHSNNWHCGEFEKCKFCGKLGLEGPHKMIHDSEWRCVDIETCKYCGKEGKNGPHPSARERMRLPKRPGAHRNECPLCHIILPEVENPSHHNGQPWHYED